jgi:acetyl-CoA carboxylase carboxyl transferase subunit beta
VVREPGPGAHTDPVAAADLLGAAVFACLDELRGTPADQLVAQRRKRLRDVGTPGQSWRADPDEVRAPK